jgi:flavin-dependent dehydrogenase
VRLEDEAVGRALQQVVLRAQPRTAPLQEWRATGAALFAQDFGPVGALSLHQALERLCDWHPPLREEPATIYSPCLEGVGDYPVTDGALSVAPGVSVVGDATGRFRGIVASMVSGRYAALATSAPA